MSSDLTVHIVDDEEDGEVISLHLYPHHMPAA